MVLAVEDGAADVGVVVEAVVLSRCRGGRRRSLCGSGGSFRRRRCRLSPADCLSSHDAHGGDGPRYGGLIELHIQR